MRKWVCKILLLCMMPVVSANVWALQNLEVGVSSGIYGANIYRERLGFNINPKDYPQPFSRFNLGLELNFVFSNVFSLDLTTRLSTFRVNDFSGGVLLFKDTDGQDTFRLTGGNESVDIVYTVGEFSFIPKYRLALNDKMFLSMGLGFQLFQSLGIVQLIGKAKFGGAATIGPSIGLAASFGYHYRLSQNILLQSKIQLFRHLFDIIKPYDNIIRFSYGLSVGVAYSFDMR